MNTTHGIRDFSASALRRRSVHVALLFAGATLPLNAQTSGPPEVSQQVSQQIQALTESMARTQAQLEQSQRELEDMRRQLATLQNQLSRDGSPTGATITGVIPRPAIPATSATALPNGSSRTEPVTAAEVDDLRERQAVQGAQIGVHEQAKVESESKYPVRISGLLLFNAYTNSAAVDTPANPTYASAGGGSTGASVRQTMLGIEARGPHLLGAVSAADLHVDFFANPGTSSSTGNYSPGYSTSPAVLRLRTAHATLDWAHTEAFTSLDRPLLSPDVPHSLTAVAIPEFAWTGYLWTWNPQVGVMQNQRLSPSLFLRVQAALLDVGDAPSTPAPYTSLNGPASSSAEGSRRPSAEARIALVGSRLDEGAHLGVSGYFSPHSTSDGRPFNAWAGTVDYRIPLAHRLSLVGNTYRGLALGGLGGGAYKDYLYRLLPDGTTAFRPFDAIGGWTQLQARPNERVELNAGFGIDEGFAREIRPFLTSSSNSYQSLSRNRSASANVIYSPSAYLLFSLEYRRLQSLLANGVNSTANIFGIAAGYRF